MKDLINCHQTANCWVQEGPFRIEFSSTCDRIESYLNETDVALHGIYLAGVRMEVGKASTSIKYLSLGTSDAPNIPCYILQSELSSLCRFIFRSEDINYIGD